MKKILVVSISIFLLCIIASYLFFIYMTSDQALYSIKEIEERIRYLDKNSNIEIVYTRKISPQIIDFSFEKRIKNVIRKILSFASLVSDGPESAEEYIAIFKGTSKKIITRVYIFGDHIYGINIKLIDFEEHEREVIVRELNRTFKGIELIVL